MIFNIISKEFRLNLTSFRFLFTLVLCLITAFVITIVLCGEYKNNMEDYREHIRYQQDYLEYGKDHYIYKYMISGIRVFKPLNSLKILFSGMIRENSPEVQITIDKSALIQKKEAANLMAFLFKHLDVGFFISVVISLIAFVFGYDSITREKEEGTLKLLLTNPVSRITFIFGKIIGGFLSFIIPFTLSLFLILVIMFVYPEVKIFPYMGTIVILYIFSLIYLFLFYLLSVLISANCKKSTTSINILLLVWLLLVLIIPSFGTYLSMALSKTNPAKLENEKIERHGQFMSDFWEVGDELWEEGVRGEEYNKKVSEKHIENNINHYKEIKKIDSEYFKALDNEIRMTKYLTYISPRAVYLIIATELADTGITDFRRFYNSILQYKEQYFHIVFKSMEIQSRPFRNYRIENIPEYKYDFLKLSERLKTIHTEVLILLTSILILLLGIIISILKYDVC